LPPVWQSACLIPQCLDEADNSNGVRIIEAGQDDDAIISNIEDGSGHGQTMLWLSNSVAELRQVLPLVRQAAGEQLQHSDQSFVPGRL
jgi:hypothetical protein